MIYDTRYGLVLPATKVFATETRYMMYDTRYGLVLPAKKFRTTKIRCGMYDTRHESPKKCMAEVENRRDRRGGMGYAYGPLSSSKRKPYR